jgi:hypothetical protein
MELKISVKVLREEWKRLTLEQLFAITIIRSETWRGTNVYFEAQKFIKRFDLTGNEEIIVKDNDAFPEYGYMCKSETIRDATSVEKQAYYAKLYIESRNAVFGAFNSLGIACSHPNGTDNTFSGVDMKNALKDKEIIVSLVES